MARAKPRILPWSVVVLVVAGPMVAIGASPASAGASCFGPPSAATGTHVALKDQCFGPTVLFARPGTTVRWTNEDSEDHTVTGLGFRWGSEGNLVPGASIAYRFRRTGVYPYTCIIHPGMVGAVVVGDAGVPGAAGGVAAAVAVATPSPPAPRTRSRPVDRPAPATSNAWRTTAMVSLALLVLVSAALIVRRRLPAARPT
jgi:plastocyanin